MAPGMIQAFAEGKLAFLKSWLGIDRTAQNGPWNAFADAVRAQAKSLAEVAPEADAVRPASRKRHLPQWVDRHLQMMGRASRRDEEDQAEPGCPLPGAHAGAAPEGRSTHPHGFPVVAAGFARDRWRINTPDV